MPVPQPGETVTVWMWPSDFGDLQREGSRSKTAVVEREQRHQLLIPVQVTVMPSEVHNDPPLRFPERKQQDSDDTPLQRARKRYHAIFADLIQNPWERDDTRHAFHTAHPELPDDERHFNLEHYQLALEELQARGPLLLLKALKVAAKLDPADPEDAAALEELLEGANPAANSTKRARWVIELGVGEWIRECLAYHQTQAA